MTRRERISAIIDRLAAAGHDFGQRQAFYMRLTGKTALGPMTDAELARVQAAADLRGALADRERRA